MSARLRACLSDVRFASFSALCYLGLRFTDTHAEIISALKGDGDHTFKSR